MSKHIKFPRIPHLPFSPGATNDDRVLADTDHFRGRDVVVTLKLDGECTSLYSDRIHARSLDGYGKGHGQAWMKARWGAIAHHLDDDICIIGENVYAKHTIYYDDLDAWFYTFMARWRGRVYLDWYNTSRLAHALGLALVKVLYIGPYDELYFIDLGNSLQAGGHEGFVVRSMSKFKHQDFGLNVAKWVRANHVQTDQHWQNRPLIVNKRK